MEYFIEHDTKIMFLETKVKILKEKEAKLEKELTKRMTESEEFKYFIQN